MKAMLLKKLGSLRENGSPLEAAEVPMPEPRKKEILVKVSVCGVCHTELDEIEGRTPPQRLPVIPGHQIVGTVERRGTESRRFQIGERVGIAWIHSACGKCAFCRKGFENLCENFEATGRDADGGYAEYTLVGEGFAYKIPEMFSDEEAAPLLCAGAIGYRSLRLTGLNDGENVALVGFGASGHLVIKMIRHLYPNSKIFVFSRTEGERDFAREAGANWTGDFTESPPFKAQAAIDTTPVWAPLVHMLAHIERGGRFIINAIRKEDFDKDSLLKIDYPAHLWMEKEIKTVANITRRDVEEFLALASEIPIRPAVEKFSLHDANKALLDLKERRIRGAKVLMIGESPADTI